MGGFQKCGIYPINPGEVNDQQLVPSKAVQPQSDETKHSVSCLDTSAAGKPVFTPKEEKCMNENTKKLMTYLLLGTYVA